MKRLFSFLLALTILVSLSACGDPAASDSTAPSATENSTQPDPTECIHDQVRREKPATCLEPGQIILECRLCGEILTEEIPATGHRFADATCENAKCCIHCGITEGDALGHSYVSGSCSRCGAQIPDYGEQPSDCDHAYTLSAQTSPSCTTQGSFTYTCEKCDATYTETVVASGHHLAPATCLLAKTCSVCGHTEGTALGHNYQNGSCSRCDEKDPSIPAQITYTVTVRSDKGAPIAGVLVSVFTGGATPAATGTTDQKGIATMVIDAAERYTVTLSQIPQGYAAKESYSSTSTRFNINLTTLSQITPEDHSKANYKTGSLMGEFSLTDTDGNHYTLSKLLQDKDLVILNFWFVNCGPCKAEFPYFEGINSKYDNVQLLTLNHIDSQKDILTLRQQMGVTFPMIVEDIGFQQGFGISAYPTTVFIDKTGRIVKIQVGDFKNQAQLEALIESYL